MAFDRKYYNEVKKFTAHLLRHKSWCDKSTFEEHVKSFLPLISSCNEKEDFEGAKATADAIKEFLNEYLPDADKIPAAATLKLPKYEPLEMKGIVCCGKDSFFL